MAEGTVQVSGPEEQRKGSYRLARLAEARGTTAVALVREVILECGSYAEAARRLGISSQALLDFRQRNRIKVRPMKKGERRCPRCKGEGVVMEKRPVPGHEAEFYMPGRCEHGKGGGFLPSDSAKSEDQAS